MLWNSAESAPSLRLTRAKFTVSKKLFCCRSDLEHSKTTRKNPGNAPEQRTYSTYNISKAQLQPTTEKKVIVILHCYFYDDTHGSYIKATAPQPRRLENANRISGLTGGRSNEAE